MPDVSVTVNNVPIQVTSCISNVIDVSVATAGSQGATGPIGPTGATGPAGSNGSIGITGVSVTGYYSQTGLINFTGAGSTVVLTGLNNTIIFSGTADTSNFSTIAQFNALSGNVYTTGQTLNNRINLLSGYVDNTFALLSSPRIFIGSGSPEGSVQAVSGSLYTDWYNQTFYMKISGNSSNAYGWV